MKLLLSISLCVAALVLSLVKVPVASAHDDVQGRTGVNVKFKLDERTSLILDEEFRVDTDDDYYVHTEIGVTYEVLPWLSLGAAFRQIFEEQNDNWEPEFRPQFQATFKRIRQYFSILDRNQFEYRIYKQDPWKAFYRNRLKIGFPFVFDGRVLSPYIADEIFVRLNDPEFNRNRVYGGLDFIFWRDRMGMDLYYFWERGFASLRGFNRHVIGLKIKIMPLKVIGERPTQELEDAIETDY